MTECTVYSPCGRYVVRFSSDTSQQRLWLEVRANALRPDRNLDAVLAAPAMTNTTAPLSTTTNSKTTPGIVWPQNASAAPSASSPRSPPTSALHLVATLSEAEVVALTSSAGVRKSFANFSKMLYDALIGRSSCVHFYVETVAEMKERIQRDVQRQQQQQQPQPLSSSSSQVQQRQLGLLPICTPSSSPSSPPSISAGACGQSALQRRGESSADDVSEDVTLNVVAALRHAKSTSAVGNDVTRTGGKPLGSSSETTQSGSSRVRAAVGDTLIELDEDIADEVLEQRFLTVDYDVDFTRAIFPIPLTEPATEVAGSPPLHSASPSSASTAPASRSVDKSSPSEVEAQLRQELRAALERAARVERENDKLRKENAALMQLSKQKMQEMQRLCEDFQQRVREAADAEKLRAKNAALRVQLQEAVEERQAAERTLERERSQRRLLTHSASSPVANEGSGRSGDARRSSNSQRRNPYLRSLSRDSARSAGAAAPAGSSLRRSCNDNHHRSALSSRHSSVDRCGGRLDRFGRPLLSPTPTPTSRRRGPSRFDTPPNPSTHARAGSRGGLSQRASSASRHSSLNSGHPTSNGNCGGGGGGDSPAPRDRTGGRQAEVLKPRRSLSSSASDNGGATTGRADHHRQARDGSRASSRSSPSLPRRGPSLWADTSDHPSPRGSVASSRGSSASHERLYRATTASSRQHQTPKAYALEELGARRAVFH